MNIKNPLREYSSLTAAEQKEKYAAFATYEDSGLTNSVYILGCSSLSEAAPLAKKFFTEKAQSAVLCKTLKQIDIMPQGEPVWTTAAPALVITFEHGAAVCTVDGKTYVL